MKPLKNTSAVFRFIRNNYFNDNSYKAYFKFKKKCDSHIIKLKTNKKYIENMLNEMLI